MQESDDLVSLNLCLGYSDEHIDFIVRHNYYKDLLILSDVKRDEKIEKLKRNMEINIYPIYTCHMTMNYAFNDFSFIDDYKQGHILHKNHAIASVERVFEEPYEPTCQLLRLDKQGVKYVSEHDFEIGMNIKQYLFLTHEEGKSLEELDTWLLKSKLMGIDIKESYLTRQEMYDRVDKLIAELDVATKAHLDEIEKAVKEGFAKDYKSFEIYLEKTERIWNILMYLGKNNKGKDAWLVLKVIKSRTNENLYKTVHELPLYNSAYIDNLEYNIQIGKMQFVCFNASIELGNRNVYNLPHSPVNTTTKYTVNERLRKKFRKKGLDIFG